MDYAYLHLITNHIPIIGVPFTVILLLLGISRKSGEIIAAAFLAFAFIGAATVAVYFIGEEGEDFIEKLAGISEIAIEEHQETAWYAMISMIATGALSLIGFFAYGGISALFGRRVNGTISAAPAWLSLLVLIMGLVSTGLLGYTARLGGQIRHTEFYGGAQTQPAAEIEENEER